MVHTQQLQPVPGVETISLKNVKYSHQEKNIFLEIRDTIGFASQIWIRSVIKCEQK